MPTLVLTIDRMLSLYSVRAVWTALGGVEGVRTAEVVMGMARVEHDGSVTCEAVAEAVEIAGCEVVRCEEEKGLPVL
jgi:copper chaperone CopZ